MFHTRQFKIIMGIVIFVMLLIPQASEASGFNRGAPKSERPGWGFFNSSWYQRVSDGDGFKSKFLFTYDFGYMHNITENKSVGGSFYVGLDDNGSQLGLMSRYRYWYSKKNAYDVNFGLLMSIKDNSGKSKAPGFVIESGLVLGDIVSLMVHYHRYKLSASSYDFNRSVIVYYDKTISEVHLGGRFGSYAAFVIPLVTLGIIVAFSSSSGGF